MKDLSAIPTEKLNATQKEFLALLMMAGWTQAEAARQLNVSRAMITQTLNGKTTPAEPTMELLRMKVNGLKNEQRPPQDMIIQEPKSVRRVLEDRAVAGVGNVKEAMFRVVQQITAPIIAFARGGAGAYPEDQGDDVPRIAVPCKDPNCYVLELEGNSMEPIYLEGDLLVVAPNTPPQNNDLVVVRTVDDEVLFKQFKHPKRGEEFQFLSYNPHHPPLLLRPDQIFKVSVVDCVIRPLKHKVRAMTVR